MWHTLLEQNKGFGSVGPNQVGLCGVSHFRFKSLLNPLLRLVVNSIFISVCRDDRQPSSRVGPAASACLLLEAGSIDERQKSHHPSVSWLAGEKLNDKHVSSLPGPCREMGQSGLKRDLDFCCVQGRGDGEKSWFKSIHNAFPLGDLPDKKQAGCGSDPYHAHASSLCPPSR